jgi:hypothetical protein
MSVGLRETLVAVSAVSDEWMKTVHLQNNCWKLIHIHVEEFARACSIYETNMSIYEHI